MSVVTKQDRLMDLFLEITERVESGLLDFSQICDTLSVIARRGLVDAEVFARASQMSIEGLDLDTRTISCLWRRGITDVGQLLYMSEDDLLWTPNLGPKSLSSVQEALAAHGMKLLSRRRWPR